MSMKKIWPVVGLLALGACTTFGQQATVVSASESSVTLRYKEGRLAEATKEANAMCARYGRTAVLQQVNPTGDDQLANFNCVP